jgi:hypothetical protein
VEERAYRALTMQRRHGMTEVFETLLKPLELGTLAGAALSGEEAHPSTFLPVDLGRDVLDRVGVAVVVYLRHIRLVPRLKHAVGQGVVERFQLVTGLVRQGHPALLEPWIPGLTVRVTFGT